jgi:predicted XRE-type DNA-binding protein
VAHIDVAALFVVVWSAEIRQGEVFMHDLEPTIRSRELGDGLRQAIEQAGLNAEHAAHVLSWSPSKVSRLLSGKRNASEVDVAIILGMCRVKGEERDRLLALCQERNTPGWLQQYGSRLPQQLMTLIDHENRAVAYSDIQPVVYLEGETSCLFLEKNEEIAAYRLILGALADTTLGERESRELIATVATELYADQEDPDERA